MDKYIHAGINVNLDIDLDVWFDLIGFLGDVTETEVAVVNGH
jgi:hypothetical protein